MMRLRKIWAEGSFSVLKREHSLSKIRKRGIPAVTVICTPFTGHPVEGVLLCGTHMSTKGNV